MCKTTSLLYHLLWYIYSLCFVNATFFVNCLQNPFLGKGLSLLCWIIIIYSILEVTPEAWLSRVVVVFLIKGDKSLLKNYRPISLLSHFHKLFSRVITNCLARKFDDFQNPEQAGFRKGYRRPHTYTTANYTGKSIIGRSI